MNAFIKFPKMALALLIFIVFNSCSKDTDLISGYIINSSKQKKDVSMLFGDNFEATSLDESIIIDVSSNNVPKWEKIKITEVSRLINKVVVF